METEQALEQAARWQQLLCRLESVETAHVVFAPDGSPAEVHVLARAGKNAKAVAVSYTHLNNSALLAVPLFTSTTMGRLMLESSLSPSSLRSPVLYSA